MQPLSPELFWLTLTVLFTGLMWAPYILQRIVEQGLFPAMGNQPAGHYEKAAWAMRLKRAHENAVENLVLFAPLAIAVHVASYGDGMTAAACAIYFLARVAHAVVMTLGIPVARTLAFAVGAFCNLALALRLLGML